MLQGLFTSISFIHFYTHQHSNEILCRIANIIPVRRIELKLSYYKKKESERERKLPCRGNGVSGGFGSQEDQVVFWQENMVYLLGSEQTDLHRSHHKRAGNLSKKKKKRTSIIEITLRVKRRRRPTYHRGECTKLRQYSRHQRPSRMASVPKLPELGKREKIRRRRKETEKVGN